MRTPPIALRFALRCALGTALVSVAALAQAPASEVAIDAEPSHRLVLDNAYVKAFLFEVAPGAATLMHRHAHDYFFVTLGPAEFENVVAGKAPARVQLKDGETRFSAGGFSHVAKNVGTTSFRNVTIEILQGELGAAQTATPSAEELKPRDLKGGSITLLLVKDGIRASEVRLQPGGVIPQHRHADPHLLVAVTDLALRSESEGQGASTKELKAGEVAWVPPGTTHTVTNASPGEIRFVTFDFPAGAAPK